MQTFVPYADFTQTAKVLDYRRLGKQRVETFQILNILLDRTESSGWRNHPAVRMWRGFEAALQQYQNTIIQEWVNRGYKNNMSFESIKSEIVYPTWFGDDKVHRSHRSNLLRKDFEYYSEFFNEPTDLEYHWPI
jgi:hypothetical protein